MMQCEIKAEFIACKPRRLSLHAEQGGKILDRDQPVGIDDIPERKDEGGDERRPDELASEMRDGGGAGVGSLSHGTGLLLAAYPPWQHREQRDPPDEEIDRERGR